MLALFSTCIASIKSGRMSPRILFEEKTDLQKEKGTTKSGKGNAMRIRRGDGLRNPVGCGGREKGKEVF